jgi:hypothetical protein
VQRANCGFGSTGVIGLGRAGQSLSLPHVDVGACAVVDDTAARVELAAAVWLALAPVLVDPGAADGRPPPY